MWQDYYYHSPAPSNSKYHPPTLKRPEAPIAPEEYGVWKDQPYGDGMYTMEYGDTTYFAHVRGGVYRTSDDWGRLSNLAMPWRWYRHAPVSEGK